MTTPRIPDELRARELSFKHATVGVEELVRAMRRLATEARSVAEHAEKLVTEYEALAPTATRQLAAARYKYRQLLGDLAAAEGESDGDQGGERDQEELRL